MTAATRTVVVTGGSSGIGAATIARLRESGNRVVNVDLRGGDVDADLTRQESREEAARRIEALLPDGFDALITCAGGTGERLGGRGVSALNYFGSTRILSLLRPLLAKGHEPRAVVISSSTSFLTPDAELLAKYLADDEEGALAHTDDYRVAYRTGKRAISHWVRRNAVLSDWAGSGILLNGVTPGLLVTPMTQDSVPAFQQDLRNNPTVPIALGAYPQADAVAPIIAFLSSADNCYMVGQMVAVDGGSDVLLRGEACP